MLCSKFKVEINNLLKRQVLINEKKSFSRQDSFYEELIHHAKQCLQFSRKIDNHSQYHEIESYINNENNTCPLVLVGSSGSGKSSLIAFSAIKVKT